MKYAIAALLTALSLTAAPITAPVFDPDGQEVAPLGQKVIAQAGETWRVCLNDNPGGGDNDANDACGIAAFGASNSFTLAWEGAASAWSNELGVWLQSGWVTASNPLESYFYVPGLETIFRGKTPGGTFYSGPGWRNSDGLEHFYAGKLEFGQDGQIPEPATLALAVAGLVTIGWLRRGALHGKR